VTRPHGLRGEVGVQLLGDDPERLSPGRELSFEKEGAPERLLRVASRRSQPRRLLVRFEGVETRESAELLVGGELSVTFDPAAAGPGEYYPHQLEGLRVVSVTGEELGRVVGVIFGPGREFLEIAEQPGRRVRLVPFHGDIVKEVDLAGGRVTIDPPQGLLDL
jgi:16S rRNA processing protein RimM